MCKSGCFKKSTKFKIKYLQILLNFYNILVIRYVYVRNILIAVEFRYKHD